MVYLVTPPLDGRQLISGSMDGMFFGYTGSRKLTAYVTTQALVMSPQGETRGVLSGLAVGTTPFSFYTARASRLENELGLPIEFSPVQAEDGDVIAVALGMTGDNRTKSIIYGLGYRTYANRRSDVSEEGTRTPATRGLNPPSPSCSWSDLTALDDLTHLRFEVRGEARRRTVAWKATD